MPPEHAKQNRIEHPTAIEALAERRATIVGWDRGTLSEMRHAHREITALRRRYIGRNDFHSFRRLKPLLMSNIVPVLSRGEG